MTFLQPTENPMHKRSFLLKSLTTLAIAAGLALVGCTTTTTSGKADNGAVRKEINLGVENTLERLYKEVRGSRELVAKANGVLVFPNVLAAGFVVGGEY